MSFRAKGELLLQIAPRYREPSATQKGVILDEFVAVTGYARKYALRILNRPVAAKLTIQRPRQPHYGPQVQQALHLAWTAANRICAKRLIPNFSTLVESLERHGHLQLADDPRTQLLTLSPATADRLLRPYRKESGGISTTRSGTLRQQTDPDPYVPGLERGQARVSGIRPGCSLRHAGPGSVLVHTDLDGCGNGMDGMPVIAPP